MAVESTNRVFVVFFDDIRGSTALKEKMARNLDEEAFQKVRREHDDLLTGIITRDGAGQVIKSTGDGFLAVFDRPSVAVERSMEIQERLHGHHSLSVRIGLDMGEIRVESEDGRIRDIFGRHVDWAARTAALADGGHVCVTRTVYTDAYSWITKTRIRWKEHGFYRIKAGEPPLDIFEPHNANIGEPMPVLRGEQVSRAAVPESVAAAVTEKVKDAPGNGRAAGTLRLIKPWEAVARDGREFAQNGVGMMYWFKVPLGGICYQEGFRNFLQPALDNPNVRKIRFILDDTAGNKRKVWSEMVVPNLREWATIGGKKFELDSRENEGRIHIHTEPTTTVAWVFEDLSEEFTPSFKFFVADPDTDLHSESQAQIFLATATRRVRFSDGSTHSIRVPDAVIRVSESEDRALLHALNLVANQWDTLFS